MSRNEDSKTDNVDQTSEGGEKLPNKVYPEGRQDLLATAMGDTMCAEFEAADEKGKRSAFWVTH